VFLTADGVTGDLKATTAVSINDIYGVVTRQHGVTSIAAEDSGFSGAATVLIFTTLFVPNRKVSSAN